MITPQNQRNDYVQHEQVSASFLQEIKEFSKQDE